MLKSQTPSGPAEDILHVGAIYLWVLSMYLLHFILLAPGILRWLLNFLKTFALLEYEFSK